MKRPFPNYIPQDEEETPAQNTRPRKHIQRTITQEAIIYAMEITYSDLTARQCASRNFPMQLLCDLANSGMDANGELLQYCHLMARPEYRVMWVKAYTNKLGRLAQVLPGVVDGTDHLDFIIKNEVPFGRLRDVTYVHMVCNY